MLLGLYEGRRDLKPLFINLFSKMGFLKQYFIPRGPRTHEKQNKPNEKKTKMHLVKHGNYSGTAKCRGKKSPH
jgi:hypothetical protein